MTSESCGPVHYLLISPDPRNHSYIDVKQKDTGVLCYRKIRHMVPNLYALSLIEPDTFTVLTEIQSLSSSAKEKVIMLHEPEQTVRVRQNGRLGFEWAFEWEGQKLRWVKESPLSSTLECRLLRPDMEICVAQYLPRNGMKGSYFGVFSVLENNMSFCVLRHAHGLKLAIMTILFTFLDKSDDDKRRVDKDHHLLDLDLPMETRHTMDEDKLHKQDLETDKMLMKAMQKEERRTEKQLKRSSAYSSTTTSPAISPIPSPSNSSTYTDAATTTTTTTTTITPATNKTKRSAPLLRSLSYSSRDSRNRSANKLTSFLTPFTKVAAAEEPIIQKSVRHHHRALSVGITDIPGASYDRYR